MARRLVLMGAGMPSRQICRASDMPRDIQDIVSRNRATRGVGVLADPTDRPSDRACCQRRYRTDDPRWRRPRRQPPQVGTQSFGGAAAPQTSQLPGWTAALGSPAAAGMPDGCVDRHRRSIGSVAQAGAGAPLNRRNRADWRGVARHRRQQPDRPRRDDRPRTRSTIRGASSNPPSKKSPTPSTVATPPSMTGRNRSVTRSFGFGNMVPDTGNSSSTA